MEIKASSKYDWMTIKKLNNFHFFVRFRVFTIVVAIVFAAYIITVVGRIPSIILFTKLYGFSFDYIRDIVFYVVFMMLWVFWFLAMPKIRYKRDYFGKDSKNDFVFTDENIKLTQTQELHSSESVLSYNAIWRVYESKEFIYMYIGKRRVYIVDKSTIEGGTALDLRMLLVQKIGADKYKIKCKG